MTDEPSNVTPIARFHTCASCHLEIEHSARFTLEAHGEECMQPEIRMRRAEMRIFALVNAVNTQTELIEMAHRTVIRLEQTVEELARAVTGNPNTVLLKESHGKPQDPEPDTKRSGYTGIHDRIGPGESCSACYFGRPHPNAEPAEPPGEAPAGTEPAAGGPERSS